MSDHIDPMAFADEEVEREGRQEQHEPNHDDPPPPPPDIRAQISVAAWLARDIASPDFLLGELLSTTSRVALIAPTGLGKTNFAMAFAFSAADGADFLHWRGSGKPRRVLFIDGEMSQRLMRRRLEDAVRRHGRIPDTLFIVNREQFPDMPPLNTDAGQQFINRIIEALGGVDLVVFDNVQSLLNGDMKDEESWQAVLPWVRDLTRRHIGQVWVHHTGHDETHDYGSKTREWQLDTVALMERAERPETDIAFRLSFTKARERAPENRSDFEPALIMLANDEWMSEQGGHVRTAKRKTGKDRLFELLIDALARGQGQIPPANQHIPPDTPCLSEALWRKICVSGSIAEDNLDSAKRVIRRDANGLLNNGRIGRWDGWVWPVRT
jgi:hypothetical protein